jgi:hypothetical protein
MKSIRSGLIAAVTLLPLAMACERSKPSPEPERNPSPLTRTTPEQEGTRGTSTDTERTGTTERMPGTTGSRVGTGEPSTNAVNAVPGNQASAVAQITAARCAREQRCNNIGTDKKFDTSDECMTEIRKQWADDLNARECPGGVVQKELSECLDEIRNEDCGNPFDTLGRVTACREGDICKALGNR